MNIKEIARLADVSVATVSRCLNRPDKVASETKIKIDAIIAQYGYSPNPSAQSLSTGTTHTIACVVRNLRNDYFTQLVEGCQSVLAEAGYRLLICTTEGDPSFWSHFDERTIDGLVISGIAVDGNLPDTLAGLTTPYVIIDHTEKLQGHNEISNVYVEDDAGITTALNYLYDEGNRVIGILCGDENDLSVLATRRIRAVEEFFSAHPDACCEMEYANYTDLETSCQACEKLLAYKERPTAIFCFSDMIAAGALRSILRAGIRIPDEMELIGFDNIPLSAYLTPPLTTIAAPNRELGRKAADLLLKKLAGSTSPEHLLYPVELMLRETTRNSVKKDN